MFRFHPKSVSLGVNNITIKVWKCEKLGHVPCVEWNIIINDETGTVVEFRGWYKIAVAVRENNISLLLPANLVVQFNFFVRNTIIRKNVFEKLTDWGEDVARVVAHDDRQSDVPEPTGQSRSGQSHFRGTRGNEETDDCRRFFLPICMGNSWDKPTRTERDKACSYMIVGILVVWLCVCVITIIINYRCAREKLREWHVASGLSSCSPVGRVSRRQTNGGRSTEVAWRKCPFGV